MDSKELYFAENARQRLLRGVIGLANAVEATLGPRGRNVIIQKHYGEPLITKDGVTVARHIAFEDNIANMGAQMVKAVASRTADEAGDGTTTATVLAKSIVLEGHKAIAASMNPMDLKRGIDKATGAIVEHLKKISIPCEDYKSIVQVGTISANSDESIGKTIADAIQRVGKEGVITVEDGNGLENELEVVEGMQIDQGYVSPYLINNQQTMSCELDNPYILLVDKKVTIIKELFPIVEAVARERRPLLIIAESIEGEALATLIINNSKGIIKVCAIKSPGFGDNKKELLYDLEVLTGAKIISDDIGIVLEAARTKELGSAKRVIVTKDSTTIIDGAASREAIEARANELRKQADIATTDYEKTKLKERAAKLEGGVAIIRVGAPSEVEMKEKKDRVDDALHATRAAVQEGIVPGGGAALIHSLCALEGIKGANADEDYGISIIRKAIEVPLSQIVLNSGKEPAVIINKVKLGTANFGYNAATDEYGDMIELGIIDPTKVTRTALQQAASVAGMLITTECTISDVMEPRERAKANGANQVINLDDI